MKAVQFRLPHIVDSGTGAVVEPVAEAQVLTDEDDRIAAEVLGEVEAQVGHGAAGAERTAGGQLGAQALAGKGVAQQRDRGGVGVDHVPVGLGLGNQVDVFEVVDVLEEAFGDFVVVEAGNEVRNDASLKQHAKDGLDAADDGVAFGVGEQVHVLGQAGSG